MENKPHPANISKPVETGPGYNEGKGSNADINDKNGIEEEEQTPLITDMLINSIYG